MKKTDNHKSKTCFIETLASMSVSEINDYIKNNAKPPKRINPFVHVDKSKLSPK